MQTMQNGFQVGNGGESLANVVTTELEVRWGECDAAGIVYHPVYIDWFSVARIQLFRSYGMSYMKDFHDHGIVLAVLDAHCHYRKTLRVEDRVKVEVHVRELTRARMSLDYRVYNQDTVLCAQGATEHVFLDEANRPVNLAKRRPDLWDLLCRAIQ